LHFHLKIAPLIWRQEGFFLNSKSQAPNSKHILVIEIWDLGFGILIPAYIAFSCFLVARRAMRVSPELDFYS